MFRQQSGQRMAVEQFLLREHGHRCTVVQHVPHPVDGIARVHRHIGRAGLERTQEADRHLDTATDANGNPFLAANTKKEPFTTIEPGRVRYYVCGPTVYDSAHIGHGRCYVAFDVVAAAFDATA